MPTVSLLDFHAPDLSTPAVVVNGQSAISLIRQLVGLEGVAETHLKKQLSIGLWKWTEASGVTPYPKYNLRYVSDGCGRAQEAAPIQHEHVWTRKSLIATLRSRVSWPEAELVQLLNRVGVACVVTVPEHLRLSSVRSEGWQRYLDSGIRV